MPFVPTADGVRLALAIRGLWWELDTVAHLLPAGRCSVERLRNLAAVLRGLADHVDGLSGLVPGEIEEPDGESE